MNKNFSTFIVLIVTFLLGALAQSSRIIDVSSMLVRPAPVQAKTLPVLHPIGEAVSINGYTVQLTQVIFENGDMTAEFVVDNSTEDTLSLATTAEFSVSDMNGNKLEQVNDGAYFGD